MCHQKNPIAIKRNFSIKQSTDNIHYHRIFNKNCNIKIKFSFLYLRKYVSLRFVLRMDIANNLLFNIKFY